MKKTQIIIIIVAAVLILGCVGTFAVLYFATDTFKSEQELFYKYAGQIKMNEFIDLESYDAYLKRLQKEAYANEGEFTIDLAQNGQTINESIKYNGYTDPVNKTTNCDVSVNKDDKTLLQMNYLNNQDYYGVLFKDVVNQYVVFENKDLKEFATKMGIQNTSQIPDKIEIPEKIQNINSKELNKILSTYLNVAMEEIPADNYFKIKKQDISLGDETINADGYQVKLKVEDVKKILVKVLENAKSDEQIYNLINTEGNMSFEDYKGAIDNLLAGFSGEVPSEENIEFITISVYKKGKDTIKLSLELEIEEAEVDMEISVEKISKGMMIKFVNTTVNYDDTEEKNIIEIVKTVNKEEQESFEIVAIQEIAGEQKEISRITLSRNGGLESDYVAFDFLLSLDLQIQLNMSEESPSLKIAMKNSTNFSGQPKEGGFVQGNHLVINGLTQEQLTNLVTNLGSLLGEKLKEEMFVKLIIETTTVNNEILDRAKQASQAVQTESQQEYQNAIEIEQQISNEMSGIGGQ